MTSTKSLEEFNTAAKLLEAMEFAAEKHKFQRRRGFDKLPYVNHLIKVANILLECGEQDLDLLLAALLHDTMEDTDATQQEVSSRFGKDVLSLVLELTDDMDLPYNERKQIQVDKASHLSEQAKILKIADKLCNIRDIMLYPLDWSEQEKLEYIKWSEVVVDQVRGANKKLETLFDQEVKKSKQQLKINL